MGGLCRTRKSRSYLFSGLLACGICNQSVVIVSGGGRRGYTKYGCHSRKHRGTCDNNLTIRRDRLEDQLLAVIEQRVLKPEIIDYVIRRCGEEVRRRFKEMERDGKFVTVDRLKRQRDDLQSQAKRLTDAIAFGGNMPSLMAKLGEVEIEMKRVADAIAAYRPPKLKITAERVREHALKAMMDLRTTIEGGEVEMARNALRKHIGRLVLTPTTMQDGRKLFRVTGNVNLLPDAESGMLLVARDGIGPPTAAEST